MAKRFTRSDVLTIPNLLSLIRLLLIPVFVLLYIRADYTAAVIVIALSGITDIADGKIARSFNMVSDLGKIIDPIADKLTQAALIICLISRYKWMIALIAFMVVKEGLMLLAGYLTYKITDTINGARWYGKFSTVVLYAAMMILVLFPRISSFSAGILIGLCGAVMLLSLVLYGRFYFIILKEAKSAKKRSGSFIKIWKIGLVIIWAAVVIIFVIHQNDISVKSILTFTPENPFLAAVVVLALYALKSLSIVVFIGLLYVASGIAFSLPVAITVNLLGMAVAVTIPYFIGKKVGRDAVSVIVAKYPKAEYVRKLRSGNDFFFSLIIRSMGVFPSDIVSLYMGAIDMAYPKYLLGSVLGMTPQMIAFTVIGTSIADVRSPAFIISACAELFIVLCSAAVFALYKKRREDRSSR